MTDAQPTLATIDARTHGRYLVRAPRAGAACPVLVGFHEKIENGARLK